MLDQKEQAEYKAILNKHGFKDSDFSISKNSADIERADGQYVLQRTVIVIRNSNGVKKEYNAVDYGWLNEFSQSLAKRAFGA